jgi:peptidoglycan/LPS O-acetylase OafA/YrhL
MDSRINKSNRLIKTNSISNADSSFLDFARGISAQLVLIGHLLSIYGINELYPNLPKIQNFGVMIFFIMSGFLITYISIIKSKEYGFKNFMIDRFSRIYSAFLPALFLIFFVDLYLKANNVKDYETFNHSFGNFLSNLFLLQNHPLFMKFFDTTAYGSARILWTVSIEWMFYICFGMLFYWSSIMKKPNIFKKLAFFFFILTPVFYVSGRGDGLTVYWLLGLVLGLLYVNNIKILNEKYLNAFFCFGVLIFVYRMLFSNIYEMYDIGLAAILFILFYIIFSINERSSFITRIFIKSKSFNSFLASYSYSLYLVHYSLLYFFFSFFEQYNSVVSIVLNVIIINLISFIFYYCFERNYFKVRTRIKNWLDFSNHEIEGI